MKKLILFLLIFSMWGCAKDTSQSNNEQQALILAASSCAMSISYDAEVTSITQPQNPADASKVTNHDKVMAQPFVKRNQVQVCIQDDGQSEWLIETKKPQNGFEPKNEGLPDPTPKTQTVRIANGKMVFIDKKGNVLRERDFKMTPFSTMAKMLKQASQNPSEMDFEKFIADAKAHGGMVKNVNDHVVSIQRNDIIKDHSLVTSFDIKKRRLLSSEVYNSEGGILSTTLMAYDDGKSEKQPILKSIVQQSYSTSKYSGVRLVTQNVTKFHRFDVQNNFK